MQLSDVGPIAHRVAFASLQGRTHRVNQDSGGAWTWVRDDGTPLSMAVVADGVSAGRHSEEASRLVVSALLESVQEAALRPDVDAHALFQRAVQAVDRAGEAVSARPRESVFSADATTLVVALVVGEEVIGGWIGDSRAYTLTAHGASRVTRDHSWAEEAVRHGLLSPEQAARDPRSHMITRWIGPQEGDSSALDAFQFHVFAPDVLLCCSDGLYGYFLPPYGAEDEMARLLVRSSPPLQERVDLLAATAMERGGHDDITAAAVQIQRVEATSLRRVARETVTRLRPGGQTLR